MTASIEFHFDFGSPNAYLAHKVIPGIEQRLGTRFKYVPVLLGGVFKATGNKSPMESFRDVENKWKYTELETQRFIQNYNLAAFRRNPFFPINTLTMMRGAVFAQQQDFFAAYVDTVFSGMWEQQLNMGDVAILTNALEQAGLPARTIFEATAHPEIKQALLDHTSRSVARGNFGSPTFFVGKEIFFGKDRLVEVETEYRKQMHL